MINEWLSNLTALVKEQTIWAPLIALLAGFLTSLTPCSLASVPLIIGYVKGSGQEDTKRSFILSLVFVIGMSITFIAIGIVSGVLGRLVANVSPIFYLIMGVFLVLMAIQIWGIYYFVKPTDLVNKTESKGGLGALISGILAGLFSSPCATPVMMALVSIVIAGKGQILWGSLLFLMYAIGHGIVTVMAGTFAIGVTKMTTSKGYAFLSKVLEVILGLLVLGLGIYFISLGL